MSALAALAEAVQGLETLRSPFVKEIGFEATIMTLRTFVGFVVAPVAPALALTLFFILFAVPGPFAGLALGFYAILLNAFVAYPVTLVAGLPCYFFYQRRGWVSFGSYVRGGLALGAGVGALPALATGPLILLALAGASFCGALVSGCFWLIARPDRIPPPLSLVDGAPEFRPETPPGAER